MQTLGELKELTINPKNCIGTVLALNGFRKYFCVYHAKHPENGRVPGSNGGTSGGSNAGIGFNRVNVEQTSGATSGWTEKERAEKMLMKEKGMRIEVEEEKNLLIDYANDSPENKRNKSNQSHDGRHESFYDFAEFDPLLEKEMAGRKVEEVDEKVRVGLEQVEEHRYEELDDIVGSNHDSNSDVAEEYVAAFDFDAYDANQISLKCGERVIVLRKSDPVGNKEWFFVKNHRNQAGFAPANRLTKL